MIFLTPVSWDGSLTIGIAVITSWFGALLGDAGLATVTVLICLTAVLTVLATVFEVRWLCKHEVLRELFSVPKAWLLLRLISAVFVLLYFFQVGPQLFRADDVGGAIFVEIGVVVFSIYVCACFLMPLLTDFGFMEFAGTLARPVFRKLFRLPGRAAIDATASFVGASSIGLLITIGQYDRGSYSAREACVIATNFSVVSIPFSVAVARVAGIDDYYMAWYGTVVLTCLIAAFITPRLPPLSRKSDSFVTGSPKFVDDELPQGESLLLTAWQKALEKADHAPSVRAYFGIAIRNLAFFLFSVFSAAMALAMVALLLSLKTPLFTWLGTPLVPLLELVGLTEAAAAAPGLFSGFMDQYIPALVASDISSDRTSFVLAGLALCQLIYMSEVGVLILRSSLPLNLRDLVAIFLLRTIIALPVLLLAANLLVSH